jgi:hypothetical protein
VTLPFGFLVDDRLDTPVFSSGYPRDKASDDTTIEVAWDAVPDATDYKLYGATSSGFTPGPGNLLYDGALVAFDHTGLTIGETWYYVVKAYNAYVESYYSAEGSAQALPRLPGAPTVTVTADSSSQIDVLIAAGSPDTADDYQLERRARVCGGSWGAWADVFPGYQGAGTYNDTTVLEGYEYEYQAAGHNISGLGDYSASDNGFAADDPGVPTGFSATKSGTNPTSEIDLAWTDPATGTLDDVEIWRSATELGTYSLRQTVAAGVGAWTDTVGDGETWWYKARGVNDCGGAGSYCSPDSATTDVGPPTDPPVWSSGYPKDDLADDTSILGAWGAVIDATAYEVYYKVGGTMSGDPVTNGTLLYDGAAMSFDHNVGSYPTTVYYQVRAKNAGGNGPFGTEASAQTLPRVPGAPSVTVTSESSGQIDVLIAAGSPDTADDYTLERRGRVCGGSYGSWSDPFPGDQSAGTYNDTTVLEGYEYEYRAKANNVAGSSGYGSTDSGKAATDPSAPTGFTATKSGTNPTSEIDLAWTDPATGTCDDVEIYRSATFGGTYTLRQTVAAGVGAWTDTVGDAETWWYKARGVNDCGGAGGYCAADDATTDAAPPATAPTGIDVSPKAATDDYVTVSYGAAADATSYEIYLSLSTMGGDPTSGGTHFTPDPTGLSQDVNVASLLGATGDDQVYANVRGKNAGGTGPWGTEANGYTHRTSPGLSATLDAGACPSIEYDLVLDHTNTDGDSRNTETIVVERNDGSGYAAISGSPFAAGTTNINDTGASGSTTGYRAKYSSESTYTTKTVFSVCPE